MILNLYQNIGQILAPITELRTIDLDKGQLEKSGQFDSILTPAALISFEEGIQWRELARSHQSGDAVISIKIVVTLPHTTAIKPAPVNQTTEQVAEALSIEDDVHNKIILTQDVIRIASRGYYVGTYYVTEHIYTAPYNYVPNPRYSIQELGNPPHISTSINL